jgi:hypothetical protein
MDLKSKLPVLLPRAIQWAEAEERRVLASGTSLTDAELTVARSVGVSRPERVRVELVDAIPTPSDPLLQTAISETGMFGPNTRGLTLGYAIFIHHDARSRRLLSHELRHVHQYECSGSVAAFLPVYLSQIIELGYENAPFEIDARAHELAGP